MKMVKSRNTTTAHVHDVPRIMGGIKKLKLTKETAMAAGRKLKTLLAKVDAVEKVCVICMEPTYTKKTLAECDIEGGALRVTTMPCPTHYICDNCIRQEMEDKCPICRKDWPERRIIYGNEAKLYKYWLIDNDDIMILENNNDIDELTPEEEDHLLSADESDNYVPRYTLDSLVEEVLSERSQMSNDRLMNDMIDNIAVNNAIDDDCIIIDDYIDLTI